MIIAITRAYPLPHLMIKSRYTRRRNIGNPAWIRMTDMIMPTWRIIANTLNHSPPPKCDK